MPKTRIKPKAKSKAKTKPKAKSNKTKTKKVKIKTKSKTKSKSRVSTKAKTKPKTKAKSRASTKAKTKVKSKLKTKLKAKPKSKTKPKKKSKTKITAKLKFTEMQKTILIELIRKIVDLRKKTVDGLKSLDAVDHILDRYNQKYTNAPEKFDAIVNFAVIEHAQYSSNSGFIAFKDTGKDSIALYTLLSDIGKGKVQFYEASDKMNSIYQKAIKN